MNLKQVAFTFGFILWILSIQAQNTIPKFKKGDRIAFVGNSITHGGHYHSYIWLYYMTHFPDMPITILNCGVGGDTSKDIKERIKDDVFSKSPTYISMTFGMNDVGYYDFYKQDAQEIAKKRIQESLDNYKIIEKQLQDAKDVTKVLIGGSPYDEGAKIESQIFPGKNAALVKVNDFLHVSARENSWGFVDFTRPMMAINEQEQKLDSLFTLCGGDRIHPDNDGHMVMAFLFLKAQGLDGNKVSEVDINANDKEVKFADNCKVSNLKVNVDGLEFTYLAKSLPCPVDSLPRGWMKHKSQKDALKLIPFVNEFNQELLSIKGLSNDTYELKIDGEDITTFSGVDLSKGVNLAELTNTPQYRQASKIMLLNEQRWELELKLQDYAWMEYSFLQEKGLLFACNQTAIDTIRANWDNPFVRGNFGVYEKAHYAEIRKLWQEEIDQIVNLIYSLNKPVTHKFELVKVQK